MTESIKKLLFKQANVNSTESFFKVMKQPENACELSSVFNTKIDIIEKNYEFLINHVENLSLKEIFDKENGEYKFYISQFDELKDIISENKLLIEKARENAEEIRVQCLNIRNEVSNQKKIFWDLEEYSFFVNKPYDHGMQLSFELRGFEFKPFEEVGFESFFDDLRGRGINAEQLDINHFEELRLELYKWGTEVTASMQEYFPELKNISKNGLFFKIENNDKDINWKEIAQKEQPEKIIDLIIRKKNFKAINYLIESKVNDFSSHQVRDLIHVLPESSIDLLKKHYSYLSYLESVYCKTQEDFLTHTEHHIENVIDISLDIVEHVFEDEDLKKYFDVPDISLAEFKLFIFKGMKLHDQAKICTEDEFLEKHDLDQPLYHMLYKHYGRGFNPDLKKIIDKLNEIDESIIDDYLSKFSDQMKEVFKKIEKLADCIERGTNSVTAEEMGKDPMSASEFLKGQICEEEMKIVKLMEKKYKLSYNSSFE